MNLFVAFVFLLFVGATLAGDISCPNYPDFHLIGRMRKGSNFTTAFPDTGFVLAQSAGYTFAQSQALFDRGLSFFVSDWGVVLNTDFVPVAQNQYCKFNTSTGSLIACILPEAFVSDNYVVVSSDLDIRKPSSRACVINYSVGPVLFAFQDVVLNGVQLVAGNFLAYKNTVLISKLGSKTVRVPLEFKTHVPARFTPELNILELGKVNMTLNGETYRGDIILNIAVSPAQQVEEITYAVYLQEQH